MGRDSDGSDAGPEADALRSVLADDLIAAGLIPHACPCDFGPGKRYRLEELIAASPRSLVYRARDTRLSDGGFRAEVAVKVSRANADRSHEALSGRRVSHPNVLRILDRGATEDGAGFVVSEYVEGGTLAAQPMPWKAKRAAAFLSKLCRGVQAAHAAGVVHCDLKPANVLVTNEGEPKLADFDLSRSESHRSDASRGNLAYMAPEQFRAEENSLAPPADMYALGGILHSLLTGRAPHGETVEEISAFHERGTPPGPTGLDSTLDAILARAMHPVAAGRYPSAAQMADDLDAWLTSRPIAWLNPSAPMRLRLWTVRHPARAVGAAAAAVALMAGVWLWRAVVERDHRRELEAQAMIVRTADAKVEEIKEKVRKQIRGMISLTDARQSQDFDQRMLPTLTWIEWLASDPVIAASGEIAAVPERIKLLQESVLHAEGAGRGEHVDTMMRRYALSQLLIGAGRSAAAIPLLDLLGPWAERCAPEDPFRVAIGVMRDCAELDTAPSEEAAALRAEALRSRRNTLLEEPGMARSIALIERVLERRGK